jgi:hypothetical protein
MLGGWLNLISILLKVPLEIGLSQSGFIPLAFTEPFVGRISITLAQEKCPVILVKTALPEVEMHYKGKQKLSHTKQAPSVYN